MSKEKTQESNKSSWFKDFYDNLLELANIFRNSDSQKKKKIIVDLIFLVIVVSVLKIPFIFVRDICENVITLMFDNSMSILAVWGLVIEILYVLIALTFFVRTLKKWIKTIDNK